ncbi:MAG: hypothetical protein F6K62_22370 [Sphaerospermopsis sp. SIO1G2]|nr:hypothetical protein [Sphaerospermopsis sp. SIO1G2]
MFIQTLRISLLSFIFFLISCSAYTPKVKGGFISRYCRSESLQTKFDQLQCQLAQAQQQKDQYTINQVVTQSLETLGDQVGVPESPNEFVNNLAQSTDGKN